jgi:hypothetical protein
MHIANASLQVTNAQNAGASAALIYNNNSNKLKQMNATDPSLSIEPLIPSAFLSYRAGISCARTVASGLGCEARLMPV